MKKTLSKHRSGFSLVELVIVVVIIAIIGAIALPRISRGAAGATDSAVTADLAVLRNAIELYNAEHDGTYPTLNAIDSQLTLYSDSSGNTNATKTSTYIYGPYIRQIPAAKVGANKGSTAFTATAGTASKGWVYDATSGTLTTNTTTEADASGKLYSAY
jgi:prepilin-type N-terminal cleavage/methylation domain-containing protein